MSKKYKNGANRLSHQPKNLSRHHEQVKNTLKRKLEHAEPRNGKSRDERYMSPNVTALDSSIPIDDAAKKARKAENKAGESAKQNEYDGQGTSPTISAPTVANYVENLALTGLSDDRLQSFINANFIQVDDPNKKKFRPILDFSYLPLRHERLRQVFIDFKTPTAIQSMTWPFLLNGDDVIGIAETGSGKTLAFGVPCIEYVASSLSIERKGARAKAVIISPTRELAMQIFDQLSKLAVAAGYKAVCIYGGVPKEDQRNDLATAQIIVATPGRLNDFIQEGSADLSDVGYVILDEADRMLDKGFEEEVRRIVSATRSTSRQTSMFTATWPASVRELAASFMQSPVRISIGDNPVGDLRANVSITQKVEVVDPRIKDQRLLQLLKQYQSNKNSTDRILVFCLYKKEAARTEAFIRSKGFKVAGIHGDLGQMQRTASLEAFRKGNVPLLVATDVAARGLDIPAVKVVINLTFPLTVEDYVHRIGRTGRAGKSGLAITLFTENEKALSGSLINVLKAAKQPVPEDLLKFGTTVKKKSHDVYGAFYREPLSNTKATKITFD